MAHLQFNQSPLIGIRYPPGGPIGSYTWQVGTTNTFTTVIASGFTNMDSDPSVPTATADKVSGLANGTYFWRVKATQLGPNGEVDSRWSAVRSFTITGPGVAPAAPTLITPTTSASFHVRESFTIQWSAVPGAHYYLLEADDDPAFSYPLTLTTNAMTFGTQAQAIWGNSIANIYYRVRAVSADNVRSLPSATLNVHITNAASVPSAVSQVAPAAGASVSVPFLFDWTDTANPQVLGYDLQVDTSPNFANSVLLLQGVARSDYMITPDILAPGNYFWRVTVPAGSISATFNTLQAPQVNAQHWVFIGACYGMFNGAQARVLRIDPAPGPATLLAIGPASQDVIGGHSGGATVALVIPAPAGGGVVNLTTNNTSIIHLPSNVAIAQGNSTNSFDIATSLSLAFLLEETCSRPRAA